MTKYQAFCPYPEKLGRKPTAEQIMDECRRAFRRLGYGFAEPKVFMAPFTYWLWAKLGRRTLFIDSADLADNLIRSKTSAQHPPLPSRIFGKCYSVAAVKRSDGTSVFPPFLVLSHKGDTHTELGMWRFLEEATGVKGLGPDTREEMRDLIIFQYFAGTHPGESGLGQYQANGWNERFNSDATFNEWIKNTSGISCPRPVVEQDMITQTTVGRLISSICAYHSAFPDRLIDGPPADITSPQKDASYKTLGPPPPQANRGGTHASPDAHYRRWHFRELRNDRFERNEDGTPKIVLVRDCYVKPDSAKTLIGHAPKG